MKTIKAGNLWAKPLCIAYIALAVICCLPCQSHSQAVTNNDAGAAAPPVKDSTAAADNRPHRPDSITTFEELDMPVEMQMELNRLTPQGILLFRDEFQGMHDGVYGQTLRMLKIWYIDDHFIGYVIDKPIEVADGKKVIKQRINIPATWMCLPTIVGHPVHTVNSLAELRATETANHCTGWYLKLSLPNDVERHVKLRKARKKEIMQAKDSAAALYGYTRKKSHKERKEEKKAIPPPPETEALPADSTGTAKPKE